MYFVGNEQSPGNGLGLYVVKRSVAKLQGDVRITSELYEGTQVWLELPIVPAAP
jgi:signal transduction histidine kinase